MSGRQAKDRWSDQGDPVKARRMAWMWVAISIIVLVVGPGLAGLGWWVAQVGSYQNNFRGFNHGDEFPWIFIAVCGLFSVWCAATARRQWARARYLERGN